MEQNVTLQDSAIAIPEQKPAKKRAQKPATKQTVIVKEFTGKDSSIEHVFDLSNFCKAIGQILAAVIGKAEFVYLGNKYIIQPLTANNSNPERAANVFMQLVKFSFPASMERHEVISSTSNEGKALLTLKTAGFKFKTLCKVEAATSVNEWIKNKRAKVNLAKQVVIKLNAEMIGQTNVINAKVKELRAENLALITGFEKTTQKQLNGRLNQLTAAQ